MAITRDGQRAVSGAGKAMWLKDSRLKVWDLQSGVCVRTLPSHPRQVITLDLFPDGAHAVSGSGDGSIRIWNLNSEEPPRRLKGHSEAVSAIAVAPDGAFIVSGSMNGMMKVWDFASGEELRTWAAHTEWIGAICMTPDGRCAVAASSDRTVKLWDVHSARLLCSFAGDSAMRSCAVTLDGLTILAGEVSGQVHALRIETTPTPITTARAVSEQQLGT